jgi:hypothetical protein
MIGAEGDQVKVPVPWILTSVGLVVTVGFLSTNEPK